jgi:uncharacterized protein (TIGR03437 family)
LGSVNLGGIDCTLLYASPGSLTFQVPTELAAGNAALMVSSPEGLSASATVAIAAASPGVFSSSGRAIAVNGDGRMNGSGAPAAAGSTLTVFLTGIGAVTPPLGDGEAAPQAPLATAALAASATIGGTPATVQSLTLTPGYAGLAQAAITVPELAAGDYPLVITVGGAASPAATVSVQPRQ